MPTYIETIKLEEIEEHSLFSVSIIQVREREKRDGAYVYGWDEDNEGRFLWNSLNERM